MIYFRLYPCTGTVAIYPPPHCLPILCMRSGGSLDEIRSAGSVRAGAARNESVAQRRLVAVVVVAMKQKVYCIALPACSWAARTNVVVRGRLHSTLLRSPSFRRRSSKPTCRGALSCRTSQWTGSRVCYQPHLRGPLAHVRVMSGRSRFLTVSRPPEAH